jgi:hypothetical protein
MTKRWSKPADPNDVADYSIIWTLDTGDTIAASTWTIAEPSIGLSITTSSFNDTTTSVWLTGGTSGDSAQLRNHITTALGRQFDQTVKLKIKER